MSTALHIAAALPGTTVPAAGASSPRGTKSALPEGGPLTAPAGAGNTPGANAGPYAQILATLLGKGAVAPKTAPADPGAPSAPKP
jgi:hypothetical protein